MPHTKSAIKRLKQSRVRHLRNKAAKSSLHTLKKNFLTACETNKVEEAEKIFRQVASAFPKAVKRGILHQNNARRNISRLSSRLSLLRKKPKEK
jgi:small subunit ribosomal protein S20